MKYEMRTGMAFFLDTGTDPLVAPDDDWEIVVFYPGGGETVHCERLIDGVECVVFKTAIGFLAQTAVGCRHAIEQVTLSPTADLTCF